MDNKLKLITLNEDHVGILCSGLCFIHCCILPILVGSYTVTWLPDEFFHTFIMVPVIGVAFFGFKKGLKKHGQLWMTLLGCVGISFMSAGLFLNESSETLFTIFGITLLAAAHFANHRSICKAGHCCHTY